VCAVGKIQDSSKIRDHKRNQLPFPEEDALKGSHQKMPGSFSSERMLLRVKFSSGRVRLRV